jgi:fermentation-respiration switch protein FrsA (DUF1100 family)
MGRYRSRLFFVQGRNARIRKKYYGEGYNVLLPDLRAHGESEGDFVGMGWLDRKDLLVWIDSIKGRRPDADIVMHGISMGGAAVMMASGEDLPRNVKAIIEDSGYTSVWDILEYQLGKRFKLPAFPILHGANIWSAGKWGYDWKDASAVNQVKKSKTPILFIHGGEDDVVPATMAYEVYQAAGCVKRLLIIEGAAHADTPPGRIRRDTGTRYFRLLTARKECKK